MKNQELRNIIREEIQNLKESDGLTVWFLVDIDSHGDEWTKKFLDELGVDVYKKSKQLGSTNWIDDVVGPTARWGIWVDDRQQAVKIKKYIDSIKRKYEKKLQKDVGEDLLAWDVKLSTGHLKK